MSFNNNNKDVWRHHINTPDIHESFPQILQQVCSNLHNILLNHDDADIESTDITIVCKVEKKKRSKRNKLKGLGPYEKIAKEEEHKQCSICLQKYRTGVYKRKLPNCRHEFHKTCIDQWLYNDKNFSCPICRTYQGNCV